MICALGLVGAALVGVVGTMLWAFSVEHWTYTGHWLGWLRRTR